MVEGRPHAHYGALRQEYERIGERAPMYLSCNSASHERLRGQGAFATLGNELYRRTKAANPDTLGFIGVPNRAALAPRLKRLGWTILRTLPLRLSLAWPLGRPRHAMHRWNTEFGESVTFAELVSRIDFTPSAAWRQRWDHDLLRWRLSNPLFRYTLHVGADAVLVATSQRRKGVPVAIVTKSFRLDGDGKANARALIDDVARTHRTPFVVYAGFNDQVEIGGIVVPERLRPSPLTLGYAPQSVDLRENPAIQIGCFEFFDFDLF